MKEFKINENITIEAEFKNSRNGFNHFATLYYNDQEIRIVKTHYINRTYESFEFESVIHKLAENCKKELTEEERNLIKNFDNTEEEMKPFKNLSMFMKLIDLMNDKPEDLKLKNDSKLRMLKAQMGEALILPDDWDILDEQTKADRLNKIKNILGS